jgi:hypothetical protein
MSIISQKDNPPSRFPNRSILETEGTWWIAKLKPRQEKAFACDLLEREIEYYLPFYKKVTKRSDGKNRKTSLVLFPSYVPFVSDNPYSLLSLNRIATLMPVQAQMRFKKQLHYIYMINESSVQVNPVSNTVLLKGELVRVISGPLINVIGKIMFFQGNNFLVLEVDGMGSTYISINPFQVEPVATIDICR